MNKIARELTAMAKSLVGGKIFDTGSDQHVEMIEIVEKVSKAFKLGNADIRQDKNGGEITAFVAKWEKPRDGLKAASCTVNFNYGQVIVSIGMVPEGHGFFFERGYDKSGSRATNKAIRDTRSEMKRLGIK